MVRFVPILAAAAAVVAASPAFAHARLVSATPAADSTVSAPSTIRLTFSERFAAPFSSIELEDGEGRPVAVRQSVSGDGRTLIADAAGPLAPGVYQVRWAIAAADGHRMTGSYSFTVR
ncbi:MAG: copper homeostasis periplasmic binding protein CopC [Brevundimonas sp.]|jgi:copper resistance protein C|uniref:copper homeostasis periplasmic binding protein CopC n=1 Tax=Brevundimonas sp. TaxID=1871086 RepID=UPI003919FF87